MPAPLGLGVGMVKQKFPDDPVQSLERLTRLIRADEHTGDLNPAQWSALRYLSRCNRFSNAPAALTRYLGATKGTVSQTLIALERKGLIEKSVRPGEARSVILSLTEEGEKRLLADPWNILDELLGSSTKSRQSCRPHQPSCSANCSRRAACRRSARVHPAAIFVKVPHRRTSRASTGASTSRSP
jgi:DNA-binding MarR family transcriptional regulator